MNSPSESSRTPSRTWFYRLDGEMTGPIKSSELKQLVVDGVVTRETPVFKDGSERWVKAGAVKGLIPVAINETGMSVDHSTTEPDSDQPSLHSRVAGDAVRTAREQAAGMVRGLQQWDVSSEVLPLGGENTSRLLSDPIFWSVILLGVIPLLIGTLQSEIHQMVTFALFFAGMWAVIFKYFIVRPVETRWGLWIGSLFFTGIVGIIGLLLTYAAVGETLVTVAFSENALVRLFGCLFVIGLPEEICKSVPILAYLVWKRSAAIFSTALMVGIFSGLGFAAFENMSYGETFIADTLAMTAEGGESGLVTGVRSAMVLAMLRSISLVFCHAVWCGVTAHFISCAVILKRHVIASYAIGITLAATLHGTYNWLQSIQQTFASIIVVISFMLFYAYVLRQKLWNARMDGEQ